MNAAQRAKLRAELERDEGRRRYPYLDTAGKVTVGVGWNLTDVGLPDDIIDELLRRGVDEAERRCRALVPRWEEIDDARQRVLLNMAFNLGDRLRQFKRLLAAIGEGDYEAAATEMLRSAWATQVKGRATRLAAMMRKGE